MFCATFNFQTRSSVDYASRIKLRVQGSYIGHDAHFDSEPYFPHGITGIFVSGGAIVGHNCVIFQQVTVGSNTLANSKNAGFPKIGNNCYIGAGAKIIGNVKVGNNCRIGANAVVTKDIPDNSTVISGVTTIITHNYELDNKFYKQDQYGNTLYYDQGKWKNVDYK